ncbi:helix-turn-helix domain-containing protein [Streptomyces kronopolitis]|uniref:helix-turn-helix domain-containing protein n=1 Tax=Streptomyces kronopolitis TaxID=1612435 RepID=UPI0027E2C616|nr:helix-turn-helix domain-containing protein [Streptomyces kronopolitis]
MATEAEGFAHLLRRLKERSGRSYGALAGQLHMSVSTLHRYCNGDAVPVDFGPAERLARLCGANREEMVELHRQWIVADEGRRRGRAASAAAAATTHTAPPSRGAGSGTSAGTPAPSGTSASAAPERNSPHAEGSSNDPSDASSGSSSGKPSNGPDDAGAPTPVTPVTAETVTTPGPPDPPRSATGTTPNTGSDTETAAITADAPTRRRLRFALAALALVCLSVPAAMALEGGTVSSSGRGSRTAANSPSAGDPPTATAKTGPAPGPSASKHSPAHGDKPKPDSATSARPEASDASRPSTGGDEVGKGGAAAPRIGVSSYNWDGPCGVDYLLQQEPERVPPPPAPQDSRGWARALGGVDGGSLPLQLTATGASDEAVVLTSLHVRVVSTDAALPWTAYSMGDGCGSGVTPRSFDIDLDDPRPTATPLAGQDGDVKVPAKNFPFKVSTHDPQVLNLTVHTEGHDVSWYLEVGWSSGSRQGTVRVDDGGKPFRTSAITGHEQLTYWATKHKWVPK